MSHEGIGIVSTPENGVRSQENVFEFESDEFMEDEAETENAVETLAPTPVSDPARTELGNAERFIRQHGDDVRHVGNRKRGEWMVWDGKRWRLDADKQVTERMKATALSIIAEAAALGRSGKREAAEDLFKWAMASQKDNILQASLRVAMSDPRVSIKRERLDTNPWVLNVL